MILSTPFPFTFQSNFTENNKKELRVKSAAPENDVPDRT
jgi:hypothetical protein